MQSDQDPYISAVICTHNRSTLLRTALQSLLEQQAPPDDFEILVVDNGSTDDTKDVVGKHAQKSRIRYIYEPELGLCNARNTGWRTARGTIVAYFDDDAIASPNWVNAIRDGFSFASDVNPKTRIGLVGGPVRPIWEIPRPDWLAEELVCSLTVIDWGGEDHLIEDPRQKWLVGTNMAIVRSVIEEIGGFHPWLDRVGTNLLSSGDVFLQKEVLRRGYTCLYSASMIIGHIIPANRLNQDWFVRRYYWQGISDAVMDLIEHRPSYAKRVSRVFARARKSLRPSSIRLLLRKPQTANDFRSKCFALIDIGYIAGLLGAARR